MKTLVPALCCLLLTLPAAAAPSRQGCYDAARAFIAPLLQGNYENLGPTDLKPDGGWDAWIASQFPARGQFTAYLVHTPKIDHGVCNINIRVKKQGGITYALFAEIDRDLRLTGLTTLKDSVEEHRQELIATLDEIKQILPDLKAGKIDDSDVLPLLKRLTITSKGAKSDITEFWGTLQDPEPK